MSSSSSYTSQHIPRIYTLKDINEVVSSSQFQSDLIDAIEDGFVSYSEGKFNVCPIQTMGAPPMSPFSAHVGRSAVASDVADDDDEPPDIPYSAQTCVKSGYLTGGSHYVIKVASGGHPFPSNSGSMQLYSQWTGRLDAILLDDGLLTELRTAAAGAAAARILAPSSSFSSVPSTTKIGILGAGTQARYQLRYLSSTTDCRAVCVWNRTPAKSESFRRDMSEEGWDVTVVDTPDDLLETCDMIVTTTSSREPLLGRAVIGGMRGGKGKTRHITCIGSDATGKMELFPELLAAADLLVADSRLQTKDRGEYEVAIARGMVSMDRVVEIGELVKRKDLHRRKDEVDERLTIFDSSGVAVQDCVIAKMVYDELLRREG